MPMLLRFHTPSLTSLETEDSTRLQAVITRAIEQAVAALGLQNEQIEFVSEETPAMQDQYDVSGTEQEGKAQAGFATLNNVTSRSERKVPHMSGQAPAIGSEDIASLASRLYNASSVPQRLARVASTENVSGNRSRLYKAYPGGQRQARVRAKLTASQQERSKKLAQERTKTRLTSVIRAPDGDIVELAAFPEIAILQGSDDTVIYGGGNPYVKAINLAHALQWGASLFKSSGYAVLQRRGAANDGPFYVIRLLNAIAFSDIGDSTEEREQTQVAARLLPVRDYVTTAVVSDNGQTYVASGSGEIRNVEQLQQTLERIPSNQRLIDAVTVQRVLYELRSQPLPASPSVSSVETDGSIDIIVDMDRTLFAAMPWEKRAEYFVLLLNAWTNEREEYAILEIIYATRNTSELEALFTLLREYDGYDRLLGELSTLDEQRFALLQHLGEFVVAGPLDWRYLVEELFDTDIIPTLSPAIQNAPEEELVQAASTLQSWLQRALSSAGQLLGETPAIGQVTEALAELLWIIELTRFGDTPAQRLVTNAVQQAEEVTQALRGLHYAEEAGTPYNQREKSVGGTPGLAEGLRALLLVEVLASLLDTAEIGKAVKQGEDLTSHLAALMAALDKMDQPLSEPASTATLPKNVTDLERLVLILTSATKTAGKVSTRQLVELLPNEYLIMLQQINELPDIPKDADIDLLRIQLKNRADLLRAVDTLVELLDLVGSFASRINSAGGVTTAMRMGLHALLRYTAWTSASLKDLFESTPAANQVAFYTTITFINPIHLQLWSTQVLKELALQAPVLAFIREAGSDITATLFERSGRSWARLVTFLDLLAIQRTRIANPILYRSFLERLGRSDDAAFQEVEALR